VGVGVEHDERITGGDVANPFEVTDSAWDSEKEKGI